MASGDPGLKRKVVADLQTGNEVELLEDQAQTVTPHGRTVTVGQARHQHTVEPDLAVIGAIQSSDQVKQRTFATPGLTRERNALTGRKREIDTPQNRKLLL
jgi:hypothetical protein